MLIARADDGERRDAPLIALAQARHVPPFLSETFVLRMRCQGSPDVWDDPKSV